MNTVILPTQILASKALFRLKQWFDPSLEGSPYESEMPIQKQKNGKTGFFLSRRLVIKI